MAATLNRKHSAVVQDANRGWQERASELWSAARETKSCRLIWKQPSKRICKPKTCRKARGRNIVPPSETGSSGELTRLSLK
jgi:hypothetical protein